MRRQVYLRMQNGIGLHNAMYAWQGAHAMHDGKEYDSWERI